MSCWTIPIHTVSEANSSEHWRMKSKRHKYQKTFISLWAIKYKIESIKLPCTIKLTRLSPRSLDEDDNLRMAFKYIKDYIADQIIPGLAPGRADEDRRIKWEYAQEKNPIYAIRIEIDTYSPQDNTGGVNNQSP